MSDLTGKTAIVTGGGSGIGEGIALALAGAGANVAICGRRAALLNNVVDRIEVERGRAIAVTADVSQQAGVEQVVAGTMNAFGAIDILVNNAGISGGGAIHEHDIAAWDEVMAVNLRGPFLMSRAVLQVMRPQRSGHIINISSEAALEHYPYNGAYGVSKHALNALGEYIQRENQELGIRVNTICPGMVITEMTAGNKRLNLDRCLTPDDIAELVLWLLSRRANIKIGRPILIQTMLNPWERE